MRNLIWALRSLARGMAAGVLLIFWFATVTLSLKNEIEVDAWVWLVIVTPPLLLVSEIAAWATKVDKESE